MTILEADEIFRVWKLWFYPTHNYLFSVFMSHIPESFLPFPKEILEEALEKIATLYQDSGEKKLSEALRITMSFICYYTNDQIAFDMLKEKLSHNELKEAFAQNAKKFTQEWVEWIKEQSNSDYHLSS
jgi:hypothetical protein